MHTCVYPLYTMSQKMYQLRKFRTVGILTGNVTRNFHTDFFDQNFVFFT